MIYGGRQWGRTNWQENWCLAMCKAGKNVALITAKVTTEYRNYPDGRVSVTRVKTPQKLNGLEFTKASYNEISYFERAFLSQLTEAK